MGTEREWTGRIEREACVRIAAGRKEEEEEAKESHLICIGGGEGGGRGQGAGSWAGRRRDDD